jgi:hypothetical protein
VLETRPPAGDTADGAPGGGPRPSSPRRLLTVLVPVVLWVLVSAAGWLRLTPEVRNTLWAEDGKVFLDQQFELGVVGALFHDYAGYLHVVPRLVVALASHVAPIDRFAVTLSLLCVLVTGAVGAAVYVLTAGVLRSVVARVLLAFVPALLPLGPIEIQANAANLHWFLMFLMPFALLTPIRSWTKGIVLGVVTLLAGLTEIQIIAFFPLFLLDLRNRRRWPVIAGSLVGGGAQVVTTLLHPRAPSTVPHNSIGDLVLGYVVEPFAGAGSWRMAQIGQAIASHGLGVVLVPFALTVVLVALGFWFGVAQQRWLLASMVWGSAAVWFGGTVLNPNSMLAFAHFGPADWPGIWTFRYTAAGSMWVLAGIVVVVDIALGRAALGRAERAPDARPGRGAVVSGVAGLALALAVVVVFALNAPVPTANRQAGPIWDQQIDSSETTCERTASADATVQIAPGPQWAFTVPCALIDQDAAR